jgi:hypothetical protein
MPACIEKKKKLGERSQLPCWSSQYQALIYIYFIARRCSVYPILCSGGMTRGRRLCKMVGRCPSTCKLRGWLKPWSWVAALEVAEVFQSASQRQLFRISCIENMRLEEDWKTCWIRFISAWLQLNAQIFVYIKCMQMHAHRDTGSINTPTPSGALNGEFCISLASSLIDHIHSWRELWQRLHWAMDYYLWVSDTELASPMYAPELLHDQPNSYSRVTMYIWKMEKSLKCEEAWSIHTVAGCKKGSSCSLSYSCLQHPTVQNLG